MQKADNDSFILSPQKNLDWLHTPLTGSILTPGSNATSKVYRFSFVRFWT